MEIIELEEKDNIVENAKLKRIYLQFEELLKELRKRELPQNIVESINLEIEDTNSTSHADKKLKKILKQKQTKIIKLLEKELKVVPKNYYRNLWTAMGIAVIGLPLGVLLGIIIANNSAYLGGGVSIGMVIGIGIGFEKDKKASKEGRQIDIEIKY